MNLVHTKTGSQGHASQGGKWTACGWKIADPEGYLVQDADKEITCPVCRAAVGQEIRRLEGLIGNRPAGVPVPDVTVGTIRA